MPYLKQSTAATIMFGPFVDKTDGVTLKTDATTITDIDHASTGIFLSKNGAAGAIRHATVTASVADAYGMMRVTLDTTDTATVGTLDVMFAKAATYLPVHKTFDVVTADVYAALITGTAGSLKVDVDKIKTQAVTCGAGVTVLASVGTAATSTAQTGDAYNVANTRLPAALTANGNIKASLLEILTTALTETAGQLAGGFKKLFDVSAPTGTLNSLPGAVPGAMGGVFIAGTNAATTILSSFTTQFTGNLTGSVGTVSGISNNVITAASIAAGAITNDAFAADVGTTAIATNVIGIAAKKGVVDALNVDTYAEAGQGNPAATTTLVQKLGYLYKAWRNQKTQTATTFSLYNDGDTVVDQKATTSDDGTTTTVTKIITGA